MIVLSAALGIGGIVLVAIAAGVPNVELRPRPADEPRDPVEGAAAASRPEPPPSSRGDVAAKPALASYAGAC